MSQKATTSLNRRLLPRRRTASLGWALVVLLALAIPVLLLERTGVLSGLPVLHVLSLATGLLAGMAAEIAAVLASKPGAGAPAAEIARW